MESIKEMMEKIGFDPDFVIKLEYKKSNIYLRGLICKTEKTLLKIQEQEGLEFASERQKSVEKSLSYLIFIHNKMIEMESIIYKLNEENKMLNELLNFRK